MDSGQTPIVQLIRYCLTPLHFIVLFLIYSYVVLMHSQFIPLKTENSQGMQGRCVTFFYLVVASVRYAIETESQS